MNLPQLVDTLDEATYQRLKQSIETGRWPDGRLQFMLNERMMPAQFIVNGAGQRFINEAAPYMDFAHAMIAGIYGCFSFFRQIGGAADGSAVRASGRGRALAPDRRPR